MIFSILGLVVFFIGLSIITKSYQNSSFISRFSSQNLIGLAVFFLGFLSIFVANALIGIILQLVGLYYICGGTVPLLYALVRTLPVVDTILSYFPFRTNSMSQTNQPILSDYPQRILVVGLTGAGKSTVIYNASTLKLSESMIHSGAKGNPMTCREYIDVKYIWCDTAGFGEAKYGAWSAGTAILELVRFLKHRRNGFHLAIFVARRGRVTEELQKTYEVFDVLLPKETPRTLVYTHDSFDYGTDKWFAEGIAEVVEKKGNNDDQQSNEKAPITNCEYLEINKMIFNGALGVDFLLVPADARPNDKRNAEEKRRISQEELRNFVERHCVNYATPLYSSKSAFRRLLEKVLAAMVRIFTLSKCKYESDTFKWFKSLGMSEQNANEAAQLLESI